MYGDVHVNVLDGSPGQQNKTGKGVQFKIGISNVESDAPILITSTMKLKDIKNKLGETPLADACMDSIEQGAKTIYCVPVKAGVIGKIGEITEDKTGDGSIEVSGEPNNAYDVAVWIVESGLCNEGTFVYSIDGGKTYTEEETIPITGEVEIPHTGLKITFKDAPGGTGFESGDVFSFTTTAPAMSNMSVLGATDKLINTNIAFEFVHIVGASSKALWASLGAVAEDFLTTYKKPCFFICEGRNKNTDEELYEYVESMLEEKKGVSSVYVQVVLSHSKYIRMDGREAVINNAGLVAGMYCRAKESQSIGEVKSFSVSASKMLVLLPSGIEEYIETLDEAKYLTFRQYAGKDDFFVTSARVMAADNSDFPYAEDVRVLNRLVKTVREKLLEELQVEIDPADADAELARIQAEGNIPIEDAISERIISSGDVKIDPENVNLLVDESIEVEVTYVKMRHLREMTVTFSLENPNVE